MARCSTCSRCKRTSYGSGAGLGPPQSALQLNHSASSFVRVALCLALGGPFISPAVAQGAIDIEPSVWDLSLGQHAADLPVAQFAGFACGTNGGPPSLPVAGWTEFARCRAEAQTGWHEIYFEYDDRIEYIALARNDAVGAALYAYTSVYSRPVIASALFDDDGFMRGLRLVTDPRVSLQVREQAYTLGGFLRARYNGDWACEQLPRGEGETPYQGIFVKRTCVLTDAADGIWRRIDTNFFRRPGQGVVNADNIPTSGYFESTTRLEEFLPGDIADRDGRLAEIAGRPAVDDDEVLALARNCQRCDLSGARLDRADLHGVDLAGANLEGASLHAANLAGANLAGANLRGANLNRAFLTQANLAGASLSRAMLYGARIDGASLVGATMIGVLAGHSRMIRVDLSSAVISDSDLTAVLMTNVIAVGTSFARSRMWQGELSRSDFAGAVFVQADMLDVVMRNSSLVDADLRGSNLSRTDLRDSDFTGANFAGALLTGTVVAGATFAGANFDGATVPDGLVQSR